jgi:hypothetical protein
MRMVYLVMLMLPNIIWTKNQPKDYEKYAPNENKVLLAFERIGEVLVSCLALIFSDFNLRPWSPWSWWLVASFALMILYEVYWIRYFRSEKTMKDFYSSMKRHDKASFCVYDKGFRQDGEWALNIKSVIVFGRIEFIEDRETTYRISADLSRKFTDDEKYIRREIDRSGPGTLLFALVPEHITGKIVNES